MKNSEKGTSGTFAVIQLSSLESTLMTLQAAMELRKSHSEIRLILITLKVYAKQIEFKLVEAFGEVFCVEIEDMDNSFSDVANQVNYLDIDVAINLSYSKMSGRLMELIKSKYRLGFFCENDKFIIDDRWSQYVYSNVLASHHSSFNFVDIFKNVLGAKENSYVGGRRQLKNKKIIMDPFSAEKKRSWEIGKWAEVIYQVCKKHPCYLVVIIGGNDDRGKADKLLTNPILDKYHNNIINIVGEKDIEEIYDEFREASLFVGHDSFGGYLASLYNVQTLSIDLGTMRPHEITPYGDGNYVISSRIDCFPCFVESKCETMPCHQDISYNAISEVIGMLVENQDVDFEKLKESVPFIFLDKIDIYRSSVHKEFGMFLTNCMHDESTIIDIFRDFYRVLWGLVLADQEITLPFPHISLDKYKVLQNYYAGLNHVIELNKFGRTYARYIIEETEAERPNTANIKKYSNQVLQVDHFLLKIKEIYPHLSPLVDFYHLSNANAPGTSIKENLRIVLCDLPRSNWC